MPSTAPNHPPAKHVDAAAHARRGVVRACRRRCTALHCQALPGAAAHVKDPGVAVPRLAVQPPKHQQLPVAQRHRRVPRARRRQRAAGRRRQPPPRVLVPVGAVADVDVVEAARLACARAGGGAGGCGAGGCGQAVPPPGRPASTRGRPADSGGAERRRRPLEPRRRTLAVQAAASKQHMRAAAHGGEGVPRSGGGRAASSAGGRPGERLQVAGEHGGPGIAGAQRQSGPAAHHRAAAVTRYLGARQPRHFRALPVSAGQH